MNARVHHVGVATDDADALAAVYGDLLDLRVAHRETVRGMRVVFLSSSDGEKSGSVDGACHLELLEPLDETSDAGAIARYLDRNGPGLHHVAFAVDDLSGALDWARACGVALVDEEPRPGAWGHRVAFLHPSSTGGVLVELVGD